MLGRGAVAYLGLDEDSQRAVDHFFERISHPALTDLPIDWGGLEVSEVYPARLPDLFVGRPVVITGRFAGDAPATVRVSGRAGGATRTIASADRRATPTADATRAGQRLGADEDRRPRGPRHRRRRGADIGAADHAGRARLRPDVRLHRLRRRRLEPRTAGDHGTTVAVPVPVPDGVPLRHHRARAQAAR